MADCNLKPDVPSHEQPVATRTRRLSNTITNTLIQVSASGGERKSLVTGSTSCSTLDSGSPYENSSEEINRQDNLRVHTIEELARILERDSSERTEEETKLLLEYSYLVPAATAHLKAKKNKHALRQRVLEQEESIESIHNKVSKLVELIRQSRYAVIYTGAGISTSASIPDYRGPNGLWTQIRKTGSFSITKIFDLSSAEPTYTHMAIKELCKRRFVKHVVSQNCDGLHLRSGIPQSNLSEIHGNMFIEVCPSCERQYYRQADITEKTSRFRHKTGRKCHTCVDPSNNLIDTIVLYGERSRTKWPMNWERAEKAAKRADLIICMGSSLKTLRRYGCLWPKTLNKRNPETRLAIINLQYTSKDKQAVLKINGKCDLVMQLVMQELNINVPEYDWFEDPLLKMSIPFTSQERSCLKRNLIFESRFQNQADASTKRTTSSARSSPSLFVSELTDDPDKKRVKLRIKAVATDPTETTEDIKLEPEDISPIVDDCLEVSSSLVNGSENNIGQKLPPPIVANYHSLPGWLGKSLGATKSNAPRRKKHGNKGRKHHRAATADNLSSPNVVADDKE